MFHNPSRLISTLTTSFILLAAACGGGSGPSEPSPKDDTYSPVVRFIFGDNAEYEAGDTAKVLVYANDPNNPNDQSDNRPVKAISLYADNTLVTKLPGVSNSNYSFQWQTPDVEKAIPIRVVAEDSAGNTGEASTQISIYRRAPEPPQPYYAAMKICKAGTERCTYDDPTQMSSALLDLHGEFKTDEPLSDYVLQFGWTSCVESVGQGECPGWTMPRDTIFPKRFKDTVGVKNSLYVKEVADIGTNFVGAVRIQKNPDNIRRDVHRFQTVGGALGDATYGNQSARITGTANLTLELRTVVDSLPDKLVTSDTLALGEYSIKALCSSTAENLEACVLKVKYPSCAAEFVCPAPGKIFSPHIGATYTPNSVVSLFKGDGRLRLSSSGVIVIVVEACGPVDCTSTQKQYMVSAASGSSTASFGRRVSSPVILSSDALRIYQDGRDIVYDYGNGRALRAHAVKK